MRTKENNNGRDTRSVSHLNNKYQTKYQDTASTKRRTTTKVGIETHHVAIATSTWLPSTSPQTKVGVGAPRRVYFFSRRPAFFLIVRRLKESDDNGGGTSWLAAIIRLIGAGVNFVAPDAS